MSSSRFKILVMTILAAAVAVGFGRAVWQGFVAFDDSDYVTQNRHIQQGPTWPMLAWSLTSTEVSNWHPATWWSHAIDWSLYGDWAGGHHLTSIVLHAINACLVYLVLVRLTSVGSETAKPKVTKSARTAPTSTAQTAGENEWKAAIVALLWAVHPLRAESVAWVAERKDVLCALFGLLTLLAYVRYVARPESWRRYLVVMVFFALGLMAKPMLVTLPCVMLLLDYWPLGRLQGRDAQTLDRQQVWRVVLEKLPLFGLCVVSSVATVIAQSQAGAIATTDVLTPTHRVINALITYSIYVQTLFWPVGLAFFYPMSLARYRAGDLLKPEALWGLGVLAIGTALAIRYRKDRPYVLVGWLWFVGTLVPVSGLFQVGDQAHADRFTYLPHLGLLITLVWGAADLARAWNGASRWFLGGAIAAAAVCLVLTWNQVGTWRDTITMTRHALDVMPDNHLAHSLQGTVLLREGKTDLAREHFTKALKASPGFPLAANNLAMLEMAHGELEAAEQNFRLVIRHRPNVSMGYGGLGEVLVRQGRLEEALKPLAEAAELEPANPNFNAMRARVLVNLDRPLEAFSAYDAALRVAPDDKDLLRQVAELAVREGQFDRAIAVCRRLLARSPNDAVVEGLLGNALVSQGSTQEGLDHLRHALVLDPDLSDVANNLAWILATHPDSRLRNGAESLKLAERICHGKGGESPNALDTLSAALAETGQYAEAARTVNRAIELAQAAEDRTLVEELRKHLAAYEQGRPIREK